MDTVQKGGGVGSMFCPHPVHCSFARVFTEMQILNQLKDSTHDWKRFNTFNMLILPTKQLKICNTGDRQHCISNVVIHDEGKFTTV